MSPLRLRLIGPPQLERNDTPTELDNRKALALLAYLAVTGVRHSRDALATLFWPEVDQSTARSNLRYSLWALKKAIGDGEVAAEREAIGLVAGGKLWLDMAEFQACLAACRTHSHAPEEVCATCLSLLAEAVAFDRGEFMAGFTLPDSPTFDEWQFFQTENLRRAMTGALERLVQGYTVQGEFEQAIDYARRRVALDTLHEPAHRQLMQLYAWAGQHAAALRQYQECTRLLADELGVPPEEATTQLAEAIRARRGPSPPPTPAMRPALVTAPSTPVDQRAASPSTVIVQPTPLAKTTPIHNLPAQTTSFINRKRETAEIQHLLLEEQDCRLLTLLGPGGVGKTRLAVQATIPLAAHFEHGLCFVPLAGVDAPDQLASSLAAALDLPLTGGGDPHRQLFDFLRSKAMLLIFDNFEQLVDGAEWLVELLAVAPALRLVVTTRQRLNLSEEWLFVVQGLDVPHNGAPPTGDPPGAVWLFQERARRLQRTFSPIDERAMVRICQLLDGLPLGIELAAAWLQSLSCPEIVAEIERNLDFLATALRNVPERQRSLRVVFEQSWQMLTADEQEAFAALSVFRGGFDRHAAGAVAGAPLGVLRVLADKSMLQRTHAGRYEIHEGLRHFASHQLPSTASAHARHAAYFAGFLAQHAAALASGDPESLHAVGRELDNIRAAWEWASTAADGVLLGQVLPGLTSYYELRGWFGDGAQMTERAAHALSQLPLTSQVTLSLAQLQTRQSWFLHLLGENQTALALNEGALLTFRHLADKAGLALALAQRGAIQSILGDNALAQQALEESVALYQQSGEQLGVAMALRQLGLVISRRVDDTAAIPHLQMSIAILSRLNNRRELARTLKELGNIHTGLGNHGEAEQLYTQSRSLFQTIGELAGVASCLLNLGLVAVRVGDHTQAIQYNLDGLALFEQFGERRAIAIAHNNLGEIAAQMGDLAQAQTHFETALAINQAIGYRQGAAHSLYHLGRIADVRQDTHARVYFADALVLAMAAELTWQILFFSPGIATHLFRQGAQQLALELLTMTIEQTSDDKFTQEQAGATLAQLAQFASAETVAIAREHGPSRDVLESVAEVLSLLQAKTSKMTHGSEVLASQRQG
jgi:predicted ATPase/DNA-binding SARP family transcriptional activator